MHPGGKLRGDKENTLDFTHFGGEEMEQGTIVKQMIDFNRTIFDNSFNAMAQIQGQTERIANMSR
jgi:hypothetical protein